MCHQVDIEFVLPGFSGVVCFEEDTRYPGDPLGTVIIVQIDLETEDDPVALTKHSSTFHRAVFNGLCTQLYGSKYESEAEEAVIELHKEDV